MAKTRFSKEVVQILEGIPNAFYVLDKSWNFVYANPQIEKLLQKTTEELTGMQFWDVFPKTSFEHLYTHFNQATETGQTVTLNEFSPKYNRWFEICVYPSIHGVVVYVTDITHRVQTEKELIKVKNELQDFLDYATVGIHWVDEKGLILYANKAELNLLGYQKDEYIGQSIAEFHSNKEVIQRFLPV